MTTLFLDTETTGLSAARGDRIVEIAIVDEAGTAVLDTLVDPGRRIPTDASRIHGITDAMVKGAPTLEDLWPRVREIVGGQHLVIYNADYDRQFFPDRLLCAGEVSCAMLRFAEAYGQRDAKFGGYRWQRLDLAARHVRHAWTGAAHRALADALACRSVWLWLTRDGSPPSRW